MKIIVVFDFQEIQDPDSIQADHILEMMHPLVKEWSADIDGCHVYIDDVIGEQTA